MVVVVAVAKDVTLEVDLLPGRMVGDGAVILVKEGVDVMILVCMAEVFGISIDDELLEDGAVLDAETSTSTGRKKKISHPPMSKMT